MEKIYFWKCLETRVCNNRKQFVET